MLTVNYVSVFNWTHYWGKWLASRIIWDSATKCECDQTVLAASARGNVSWKMNQLSS